MEALISIDTICANAKAVLKGNYLPKHNAFTISEVIGAVTGVDKQDILDKMLEETKG